MNPVEMNYLAVLVGAAVSVVVGAVWYMPALFGNPWMAAIGKTKEQVEKDFTPVKILGAFLLGFLLSYGIARMIFWTGMNTPRGGVMIGVFVSVAFVFSTTAVNHLFEGRPCKLTMIYLFHHLVELAAIGAILGAWM